MRAAVRTAVLAGMLVTACGEYPGVPHPLAVDDTHVAGLTWVDASAPAPASAGGSGSATDANGAAVPAATIHFKDFELDPKEVTVAAGNVKFTLVNQGLYTHDFRVEGNGLDEKSPRIGAGRTIEFEITLAPGEYRISCPISNHADRGMTGTLTVQGP